VGVSFGGLQAIQVAVHAVQLAPLLVLHSCAPSGLPYPDSIAERLAVPVVFPRPLSGPPGRQFVGWWPVTAVWPA